MLGVPDQVWQGDQAGERSAEPEPWPGQRGPSRRVDEQPQEDAGPQEQGGVFREDAKAGCGAGGQPPALIGARSGQTAKGQGPEQAGRGVGGGQHGAEPNGQGRIVPERGAHGAPPRAAELSGQVEDQQAGQPAGYDRDCPDAQRRVARQRQAQPDPPRDHRRVVEIAECKVLGPETIVGLVLRQRRRRRGNDPDREDQREQDRGDPGFGECETARTRQARRGSQGFTRNGDHGRPFLEYLDPRRRRRLTPSLRRRADRGPSQAFRGRDSFPWRWSIVAVTRHQAKSANGDPRVHARRLAALRRDGRITRLRDTLPGARPHPARREVRAWCGARARPRRCGPIPGPPDSRPRAGSGRR